MQRYADQTTPELAAALAGDEEAPGRLVRMHPKVALLQGALILATMYVYLRGWRRDFSVPFGFSIDSLFYLMQAKGTVDNGWWWFNPLVGAPQGLDELAFPANGNVDQAIVWMASLFVSDPLSAINFAWLAMVAVSGIAATWCMRAVGVSMPSAFVMGTLFALSPYALYKNLAHFGMAIYLIPFVCTVALQLASNRLPEGGYLGRAGLVLLIGSGLIGFNYVYYPFFGCFFISVATIVGYLTYRQRRILTAGALVLVVVAGCTALNLAPSLYSWSRNGKPIILIDKVPVHAELYALKIRTLVSPSFQHWFPPFRKWVEKESISNYPLETENMTSRLGFVGTVGFMGLLGLLLAPSIVARSDAGRLCLGASQLSVAGLLLATTGGFGALFNLLITPEIRAYSRICPFLAVFALVGAAVALDVVAWTRPRKLLVALSVLAIGLADQMPAAAGMNGEYPVIAAELPVLKGFVQQIERRLPSGSMILQLPFRRTYLNEAGAVRMQPYEHLKMYLASRHLRWSYPALSNAQVGWQEAAAAVPIQKLPMQMAAEGFSAILVDRYGYEDNGEVVISAIRAMVRDEDVVAETERYVALDIRSLTGQASVTPLPTRPGPMTVGLGACSGQTPVYLDQIGRVRGPFPATAIEVRRSRPLKISGWGVDQPAGTAAAGIDVVVNETSFPTFYGLDRVDVSNSLGRIGYRQSGFATELPPNTLNAGAYILALRVVAASRECYYEGPRMNLIVR